MIDLPTHLEMWLLSEPRWIPAAEICERFQIEERRLRAKGQHPGVCDAFAVSGPKGYKHVRHLTDEEFDQARQITVAVALAYFRKGKRWEIARHRPLTGAQKELVEKITGQRVMPL